MKFIFALLVSFILISCSSENEKSQKETSIRDLRISDISDSGKGSDIELSFSLPSNLSSTEFHVYLISTKNISENNAIPLIENSVHYQLVGKNIFKNKIILSDELLDYLGNPISMYKEYQIVLAFKGENDDDSFYSELSNKLTLVNKAAIEGRWSGSLATSLFPNGFPINVNFVYDKGVLSGDVWFSNNTSSSKHATITMNIVGNKLSNIYMDQITACGGSFRGNGTIKNSSILMETPGTDCDGTHTWFKTSMSKR